MTVFEYAGGLISIVVGLAVARVLGGIGSFIRAGNRSASDWIVASWCLALVFNLVGWWYAGWAIFADRAEIGAAALIVWVVATSLLYLAAYVLIPNAGLAAASDSQAKPPPLPAAFFFCLAAHFGVGIALGLSIQGQGINTAYIQVATMAVVSAAGAAANSNQARGWHLVIWLVMLGVLMSGQTLGVRP
jgi:hypothetical protein